jgi:hypothetical protein
MQKQSIVARVKSLPVRQKLFAAGICLTVGIVGLMPTSAPVTEYSAFALLAVDPSATAGFAKQMAESILNDNALHRLAPHLDALSSLPADGQVKEFRSRLHISQPQSTRLKVSFRSKNPAQSAAATNAVADLLASWQPAVALRKPAHQATDPDAVPASLLYASLAIIRPQSLLAYQGLQSTLKSPNRAKDSVDREQVQTSLQETETKLADLEAVSHRLEQQITETKTELQHAQRQPLETQLAEAKKKLEALRARYTDAYPDVEAAKEHVADLESALASSPTTVSLATQQARLDAVIQEKADLRAQQATLQQQLQQATHTSPAQHPQTAAGHQSGAPAFSKASPPAPPAPTASARRQGPFSILVRAEFATPETSPTHPAWLGFVIGLVAATVYLAFMLRRFRTVLSIASLEQIIPADVAYLGSIPPMTRTTHR